VRPVVAKKVKERGKRERQKDLENEALYPRPCLRGLKILGREIPTCMKSIALESNL
jgi:hypothetical protein